MICFNKHRQLLLLVIILLGTSCSLVNQDENDLNTYDILLPVLVDNKWGYINLNGQIVIPPNGNYRSAYIFNNGRGIVRTNFTTQIINDKGEVLFESENLQISPFSDGLALVRYGNAVGYLDTQGNTAIQLEYNLGLDFVNGYAFVRNFLGEYILIDKKGNEYYAPDSSHFYIASNHLLDVKNIPIYKNGFFGFANLDGEIVIEPKYDRITPFNEGIAFVQTNERWKAMSNKGILIFDLYEEIINPNPFSNDRAFVRDTTGNWRIIDKNGEYINNQYYNNTSQFSYGLAVVRSDNDWKIIDINGTVIFEENFQPRSDRFRHGVLEIVRRDLSRNGSNAYIDTLGNYIWYPSTL